MRRRHLKKLWKRLHQITAMKNQRRDALLLRLTTLRICGNNTSCLPKLSRPSGTQMGIAFGMKAGTNPNHDMLCMIVAESDLF